MSGYIFAIPSYKRADNQAAMKWLNEMGFTRADIVISTQTEEDYAIYKALHGKNARILFRHGSCISDNKNTLLEACAGKRVVMLSDAVKKLGKLRKNGKVEPIASRTELMMLLDRNFRITEEEGAILWGIYPVYNAFFMDSSYTIDNLLMGCCMGFPENNEMRFRREFRVKEDWDISLRAIAEGKKVIRFNDMAFDRRHKIKGGCQEMWKAKGDAVNVKACQMLLAEHPELCKRHATRDNEIRYTGNKVVKPIERKDKDGLRQPAMDKRDCRLQSADDL